MAENIIEIKDLVKKFGDFTAVYKMRLNVKEGEILGFLGPNGAGKTTTINMLTTLIRPTSGTARIAGHDLVEEGAALRNHIGVVPQSFSLFPELTAVENLEYIGRLYGLSESEIKKRTASILKRVSLYEFKDRVSGFYSGGMKQRLSIAASTMFNPRILFMDEPTTGLDPQSRIAIRELTKELNKSGMTIIYTTHDMDEAEKICDRIIIMDNGKIIGDGTSLELKQRTVKGFKLEVELIDAPPKGIAAALKKLPFVTKVSFAEERMLNISVSEKKGVFDSISSFFRRNKIAVDEIRYREPSLEEVFVTLTKKSLRD